MHSAAAVSLQMPCRSPSGRLASRLERYQAGACLVSSWAQSVGRTHLLLGNRARDALIAARRPRYAACLRRVAACSALACTAHLDWLDYVTGGVAIYCSAPRERYAQWCRQCCRKSLAASQHPPPSSGGCARLCASQDPDPRLRGRGGAACTAQYGCPPAPPGQPSARVPVSNSAPGRSVAVRPASRPYCASNLFGATLIGNFEWSVASLQAEVRWYFVAVNFEAPQSRFIDACRCSKEDLGPVRVSSAAASRKPSSWRRIALGSKLMWDSAHYELQAL